MFDLGSWRVSLPTSNAVSEIEEDIVHQAYCFLLTSSVPTDIPAPANLAGRRVLNRSLFLREYIDVLTWSPAPEAGDIAGYRIYGLEEGKKVLLGEVDSSTTYFWRRNVEETGRYLYSVSAVDARNREGNPSCITVGGPSEPRARSSAQSRHLLKNCDPQ